jgi:hypothetical protein
MKHWTIKGVDRNAPTADALLFCRIMETATPDGLVKWEFQTAYHQTISSQTANPNEFPIEFPMFRDRLGGKDEHDWYIVLGGAGVRNPNDMDGTWSHITWIPPHSHPTADPTDSWTAQGGAGAGDDDDDDQGSAKSAYA